VSPSLTIEVTPVFLDIATGILSETLASAVSFSYLVTEVVDGKARPGYSITTPASGTVALDSLAPVSPPPVPNVTVVSVQGLKPDASGNITLPASGGAVPTSRVLTAGTGLTGGGDLTTDRTFAVAYGSAAGTAVQGNDTRLTGIPAQIAALATRPTVRRAVIANVSDATMPNTGSSWAAVSGFEIAIPAQVGDDVELLFGAMRSANANALIDTAVIVGSTLVRFGANNTGTPALEGNPAFYTQATFIGHAGEFGFTVASGDLDGGNVRFVIACKSNGSGTLFSSTNYPFRWRAINRGVCN